MITDHDFKVKWLAALRDPSARQCHGKLGELQKQDDDSKVEANCCLGVGARVAGLTRTLLSDMSVLYAGYNLTSFVRQLEEEYGLTKPIQGLLARMNDGTLVNGSKTAPKTFAEIADFIEKYL